MLRITIEVDTPGFMVMAVKETLAAYLEKYGDVRVVKVEDIQPEQLKMKG